MTARVQRTVAFADQEQSEGSRTYHSESDYPSPEDSPFGVPMDSESDSYLANYPHSLRVVTDCQCNTFKRNLFMLLKDHESDPSTPLNCQDFIVTFKSILPNSPPEEIEKLFNILDADQDTSTVPTPTATSPKTVSFNGMLSNSSNFLKLLQSMGCITESQQQEQDVELEKLEDNLSDVQNMVEMSRTMFVYDDDAANNNDTHTIPNNQDLHLLDALTLHENTSTLPQLSWKQQICTAAQNLPFANKQSTVHSKHSSGGHHSSTRYTEYIQHQREQIMELKSKITELNEYEIKYKELQLSMDAKEGEIRLQSEEIKQLNHEKHYYFGELERIRHEYDLLLQQYTELNDVSRITKMHNKISNRSTQIMAEQVEELQSIINEYHESQEFSVKLREEKKTLNTLNDQYLAINNQLRNELKGRNDKIQKMKTVIHGKDDDIRNMQSMLLSKDQTINALRKENDDLNQFRLYLSHAPTSRMPTGRHSRDSSFGWKYGGTLYSGSRRGSVCLDVDLFEELDRTLCTPIPNYPLSCRRASEFEYFDGALNKYNREMKDFAEEKTWETKDNSRLNDESLRLKLAMDRKSETDVTEYESTTLSTESESRSGGRRTRDGVQTKNVSTQTPSHQLKTKSLSFWDRIVSQLQIQCFPHS